MQQDKGINSTQKEPASRLLEGVRVIEFGSFLAGPLMTRILADFGAEVIKLETPKGGDENRNFGKKAGGASYSWFLQARNKKSVTCNLHHPKGQELARKLAGASQIVVENFRPGRMASWGLGYDELRKSNPRLVMVHVAGFGQNGPYHERTGFGSVAEAMGGVRYLTGEPGRPSVRTGFALGDTLAALYSSFGAIAALRHAERTGEGQEIDVAITEAVVSVLDDIILEFSALGLVREPRGPNLGGGVPSNTYKCADGRSVVIGAHSDSIYRRLMKVIGKPELADDPRYSTNAARVKHREEVDGVVAAWTGQHDCPTVVAKLNEDGIPSGPIYTSADIVKDPHYRERQAVTDVWIPELERSLTMQGIVPKFSATPGSIRWTGPKLGSHNDEVYRGLLSLTDSQVAELRAEGAI
ncbi:MAG: CoA transferase [Acidobacteriota bacterium]|nr:CoA transferase [Acidobacteriota bacterium]